MPFEDNAHHVVNLPFVPIGCFPDRNHTRQTRRCLRNRGNQPKMFVMSITIKFIDHFKSGVLPVVIHTGNVNQKIKTQIGFGEFADALNHPRIDQRKRHFTPKIFRGIQGFGEGFLKGLGKSISRIHGNQRVGFDLRKGCLAILFCNFINASSNASGRGGQPAT